MDIFTTQLTRVVQVPIKPANLKVKALLKDAGAGKLKEDLDHLENHEYYFNKKSFDEKKSDKEQDKENKASEEKEDLLDKKADASDKDHELSNKEPMPDQEKGITESEDGVKHLDLYV